MNCRFEAGPSRLSDTQYNPNACMSVSGKAIEGQGKNHERFLQGIAET